MISKKEMISKIRSEVDRIGSQTAFADRYGFKPTYISDVLNGRRHPSDRLLKVFGYRRVYAYEDRHGAT